jgi:putative spermidine/putrescine transport system permease protein
VTAASAAETVRGAPSARPGRRFRATWLGVVPFFAFSTLFLLLPVGVLLAGSFLDNETHTPTLANYAELSQPSIVTAFANGIEISLVTAVAGGIFGFLLAYAVILGGLPRFLRPALLTFAGVASNFAGIPLALAFVFTIGFQGLLTVFLRDNLGFVIYPRDGDPLFTLYSKLGLELVYLYFQFPLMVLIMAPAIDGLRREWREASENLGATSAEYWRYVALPILMPTILGTIILLFGNAFGAQATAYQLTGGLIPLPTLLIGSQISGDVFHNTGLGYAMAVAMIVVMGGAIALYTRLQKTSERWLRS